MTTIRRIVTSKIDGNDANNTNINEIRPFGEIAVYQDTNGPTNKLVLALHDGQRTHLQSKVLSPGVFYGSNADSGEGTGRDTIKLIPDADLFYNNNSYGNDQYIVVDPTGGEPGHIHIRAGGTIDSSTADLYLGGELTCVRISDTSDTVTIRTTNVGAPNITMNWTFQSDGNLYFPGIGSNRIGESEPGLVASSDNSIVLQSNNGGVSNEWYFGADGSLTIPGDIRSEQEIYIDINLSDSTLRRWRFGEDGDLTFPDGTTQSTAWTGSVTKSIQTVSVSTPTVITADVVFGDPNAAGGAVNLVLPSAPTNGTVITVKNINAGGNSVYVQTDGILNMETEAGTIGSGVYATIATTGVAITWIYESSTSTYRIIG